MLYRNGEPFTLGESHLKQLEKITMGKYPVIIEFPKSMYTQPAVVNPEYSDRVDRPYTAIVPYEISTYEDGVGSVDWKYTDKAPVKKGNDLVFYTNCDAMLKLNVRRTIDKNQIDLLYFLVVLHPSGEHQPNEGRKIFSVRNEALKARKTVESIEAETDAKACLFGSTKQPIEDIIRISKQFNVTLEAGLEEDQMRVMVWEGVQDFEKSGRNGYKTFLRLINNEERIQLLEVIKNAKKYEVVYYLDKDKKWIYQDTNRKRVAEGPGLVKGKTPDESLVHHILSYPEKAQKLIDAVEERMALLAIKEQ